LLDTARARYKTVIVDTSAFVPVADATIVASRVDATVVVLSSVSSNERVAASSVARFQAMGIDNIVGVILNRTEPDFIDYSDYASAPNRALPWAPA
jgi:Mrp family chromosome partitioning ATPase